MNFGVSVLFNVVDCCHIRARIGLQAHHLSEEFIRKLVGDRVTVSPIATIEPRRRKFHKPITVTVPLSPALVAANQMIDKSPSLRLLCSMNG